jgi:uncharacterized membrane protein
MSLASDRNDTENRRRELSRRQALALAGTATIGVFLGACGGGGGGKEIVPSPSPSPTPLSPTPSPSPQPDKIVFEGLGNLQEFVSGEARAVSRDGKVIAGNIYSPSFEPQAFYWTAETGVVNIDAQGTYANGISPNGKVIVGQIAEGSSMGSTYQPFRWSADQGLIKLGYLSPHVDLKGAAIATSEDGSSIVGTSSKTSDGTPLYSHLEAFRWTQGEGMLGLGTLGSQFANYDSAPSGLSSDGRIIVGESGFDGFYWTQATGLTSLGHLFNAGDLKVTNATAVTSDGTIIIGYSGYSFYNDSQPRVNDIFRWTKDSGMVDLKTRVTIDFHYINPSSISDDGRVIAGSIDVGGGNSEHAFIWTQRRGIRKLKDVLLDLGVDLTQWSRLQRVSKISGDGRTIVGMGTYSTSTATDYFSSNKPFRLFSPKGFADI